jgi:hypothetical protein
MDTQITNYLQQYTTFKKKVVYKFNLGNGGVGDYTKFFLALLALCIKHNIRIYYLLGDSYVKDYLKLIREDMYITAEEVVNPIEITNIEEDIRNIKEDTFYTITAHYICGLSNIRDIYQFEILSYMKDIFYFTEEVKQNADTIIDKNQEYISIHLRLGDRFLEIEKHLIHCLHDIRQYNEQYLCNYIEENKDKTILFFCDNHMYKTLLHQKYNNIIITNYEIGHTTYTHTSKKQVLNTISEFYLLSNSKSIYTASYSGFSIMASKFNNIPLLYPPSGPPPQP